MGYGTGAMLSVPGQDQQDQDFRNSLWHRYCANS